MAVYVDKMKAKYGRMIMSHMIADSLDELHEMADKLGINRKWYQDKKVPHYDICQSKKALAIHHGAVLSDRRKMVELIRFWKGKTNE